MSDRTIWVNCGDYGRTYKITLAPEQKLILSHRYNKGITFDSNNYALRLLSPTAYMLYMYLIMHPDYWAWALSTEQIVKDTHLEKNDLEPAIQELIEKNFLTPGEINAYGRTYKKNSYHLWEDPKLNPDHK